MLPAWRSGAREAGDDSPPIRRSTATMGRCADGNRHARRAEGAAAKSGIIRYFRGLGVRVAEREGFEPSERLRAQRFSRPPRSTTPAPLREALLDSVVQRARTIDTNPTPDKGRGGPIGAFFPIDRTPLREGWRSVRFPRRESGPWSLRALARGARDTTLVVLHNYGRSRVDRARSPAILHGLRQRFGLVGRVPFIRRRGCGRPDDRDRPFELPPPSGAARFRQHRFLEELVERRCLQ